MLADLGRERYTVKKVIHFPVSSRDVTNQTLTGRELFKYFRPRRVWLVTSLPGKGKRVTFFTVYYSNDMSLLRLNSHSTRLADACIRYGQFPFLRQNSASFAPRHFFKNTCETRNAQCSSSNTEFWCDISKIFGEHVGGVTWKLQKLGWGLAKLLARPACY